jgi:2,4-dienoyl-CoA reductase (NADPH2)
VTLSSRIVMGSMHTGLECHPERFEQLGRFYAERAIYEGAILGNRI